MGRAWILGFFAFQMVSVLAQPVLDAPNPPPNGFGGEILVTEFVEPTAGSDEAQNWDFSDMSGVVVTNMELTPASSSLFAPSFPGAQWVVSSGDQLSFLDYTEEGTTVFGNANSANGVVLPFADPLVQWPFPVEYGFTHEDEFGVEQMLFGEPYSLDGNVTSTCDAWGSIVLPNGVGISEVLRVDYNQFYVESYAGDTTQWLLHQVIYLAPDSVLPVFFHEELTVTDNQGEELLSASDLAWYDNTVLGVIEGSAMYTSAWPNPIHRGSLLNLSGARLGARVMDLGGRTVWTFSEGQEGTVQVSTDQWSSGPYLYVPFEGAHPIRIIVQ